MSNVNIFSEEWNRQATEMEAELGGIRIGPLEPLGTPTPDNEPDDEETLRKKRESVAAETDRRLRITLGVSAAQKGQKKVKGSENWPENRKTLKNPYKTGLVPALSSALILVFLIPVKTGNQLQRAVSSRVYGSFFFTPLPHDSGRFRYFLQQILQQTTFRGTAKSVGITAKRSPSYCFFPVVHPAASVKSSSMTIK